MMLMQARNTAVRVLLVEDNPGDSRLVREVLREAGENQFDLNCVERMSEAARWLTSHDVDVILLDLSLPDASGIETVTQMQALAFNLPIVVLTGYDDEDLALRAMREGAQDYLLKHHLESRLLARVLHYAIERHHTEQALRVSEERFRALVQHSSDVIAVLSAGGTLLYESPSLERVLGYPPREIHILSLERLVYDEDRERVAGRFTAMLANPEKPVSLEARLHHADGSLRTFEITMTNLLEHPAIRGIVVNAHDISERKRSEQTLAQQANLLAQVSDAIISLDLQGRVTSWNAGAEKLYGWTTAEATGKSLADLMSTQVVNDTLENAVNTVLSTGSWNGEYLQTHKDGRRLPILNSTSLLRDPNGGAIGLIGINRDITERKRSEEALRQSEQLLRDVLETLPVGVWLVDAQGKILHANPASVQIWGGLHYVGKAEYDIYKAWWVNTGKRLESSDWGAARALSTGELVLGEELEIETFDGGRKYILNSAAPLRNSQGEITGAISVNQDVTERKRAERELASLYSATSFLFKSDSLLNLGYQVVQAVLEDFKQADCGLILKDKKTGDLLRLARGGAYQVVVSSTSVNDDRGLIQQSVRTGRVVYVPDLSGLSERGESDPRTRSELVVPLKTANGVLGALDLQSMELDAFDDSDQRVLNAFAERAAVAVEIMQLYEELNQYAVELEWRVAKRTEELRDAKEQVEAILNQSSDAIILVGADARIEVGNPAFHQLLGYSSGVFSGQTIYQLMHDETAQTWVNAVEDVRATNTPRRVELTLHRKDGMAFDAEIAIAPMVQPETTEHRVICNIRDVTERKRAEEELRLSLAKEKELNELKSRFVSMVAHDFRTPLATILSSSDLLRNYAERMTDEKKQHHFSVIQGQITHLVGLLDDVLTITRSESVGLAYKPVYLHLGTFCQSIIDELALVVGNRIQLTVDAQVEAVRIDQNLMRRAVLNLLSNAVKYSPEDSPVEFSILPGDGETLLRVRDYGIGIPEDDQTRLFELFHRAANVGDISGTGLGLAIVKRVVETHGGRIGVESQVGEGTTFTIAIPAG